MEKSSSIKPIHKYMQFLSKYFISKLVIPVLVTVLGGCITWYITTRSIPQESTEELVQHYSANESKSIEQYPEKITVAPITSTTVPVTPSIPPYVVVAPDVHSQDLAQFIVSDLNKRGIPVKTGKPEKNHASIAIERKQTHSSSELGAHRVTGFYEIVAKSPSDLASGIKKLKFSGESFRGESGAYERATDQLISRSNFSEIVDQLDIMNNYKR